MSWPIIIVQAASKAWCGTKDWCMNEIEDRPAIAHTIGKALQYFPEAYICIAAPEFDKGGELESVVDMFPENDVHTFYGHDCSPLDRIIAALEGKPDDTLIIRVDGLHFGWRPEDAEDMLKIALKNDLDCIKMPDDYPVQLSSEIYRLSALKKAVLLLQNKENIGPLKVHPKFYMIQEKNNFKTAYHLNYHDVDDTYLKECRKTAENVYLTNNTEVIGDAISHGDQFSFHYQLGLNFINEKDDALDIACGWGYGARMLAVKAAKITAADLDIKTVRNASSGKYFDNITFQTADVTALEFADDTFDAVTSFETVEHVDPILYFDEVFRVLKPGGLLILSTPQNSLGHIPVNSQHLREFSLEEITELCSTNFDIVKIIGIKQGRVVFEGDPRGQNTFIVCRKPE